MRAHRFLLEIHAAGDVETQRRVIPAALAQLIGCDRAAFNDIDGGNRRSIIPSPVPAYWSRLGPVILAHLQDHPLANPAATPQPHLAATFSDWRHNPRWRKSTLYHEYYLPAGARHQLFVHVLQEGSRRLSMNCNRETRDFSAADRALIAIASRHVECVWRNAQTLTQLHRGADARLEMAGNSEHGLLVDANGRLIAPLSSGTREIVRRFFHEDAAEGRVLPDALRCWVAAARQRLESPEALVYPLKPLHLQLNLTTLTARLGQNTREFSVVLLSERTTDVVSEKFPAATLTPREIEIATWLREGKRNAEIGTILGISTRTVGKHMEHIFAKLGVATRTAAAHALNERAALVA